MVRAYLRLHDLGWAHSFEVWDLEGSWWAVSTVSAWAASSAPNRCSTGATDASKIAMLALCQYAREAKSH